MILHGIDGFTVGRSVIKVLLFLLDSKLVVSAHGAVINRAEDTSRRCSRIGFRLSSVSNVTFLGSYPAEGY